MALEPWSAGLEGPTRGLLNKPPHSLEKERLRATLAAVYWKLL